MKLVALVLLCVVACAPLPAQTVSTVAERFQDPPRLTGPWCVGGGLAVM